MIRKHPNYWHFYWPLSLMGVVALGGKLAQNYVLLGAETGVRDLAIFTLALAAFSPFTAGIGFTPQMANVLVRGPQSLRAALRFLLTVCGLLTLPLALLAWTPLGPALLPHVYSVDEESQRLIVRYLRYLTPLIVMSGASNFLAGLLVQAHRTATVTILRGVQLALTVGMLALGLHLRWDPVVNLSLSLLVPAAAHLVLAAALLALFHEHRSAEEDRPLRQREVAVFFVPMVFTNVMFTLSRPITLGFVTMLEAGDSGREKAMVAALGLAFSFGMLFQSAVNQFRNVFVTFGRRDPGGVRAFMVRSTVLVTGLMALLVATPAVVLFLRYLQRASGDTLLMARQAIYVLVLVPPIVAVRNYYHGLAMVHRRTGAMMAGAVMRNLSIFVFAALLVAVGWYNHVWAAGMLATGFAAETLAMIALTRGWRRELVLEPTACEA